MRLITINYDFVLNHKFPLSRGPKKFRWICLLIAAGRGSVARVRTQPDVCHNSRSWPWSATLARRPIPAALEEFLKRNIIDSKSKWLIEKKKKCQTSNGQKFLLPDANAKLADVALRWFNVSSPFIINQTWLWFTNNHTRLDPNYWSQKKGAWPFPQFGGLLNTIIRLGVRN